MQAPSLLERASRKRVDEPGQVGKNTAGVRPVLLLTVIDQQRNPAWPVCEVPGRPEPEGHPVRPAGSRAVVVHRLEGELLVAIRARPLQRLFQRVNGGLVI
jgi:hypothetical protein